VIKNFHIHLYYDDNNIELAKDLAKEIQTKFSINVGTFHEQNVGPHPRWSVQISVPTDLFGDVLSYVAINRKGLTVFSHPDTGHGLIDHTDNAIWMGEILELNTEIFKN
jgi:aromatic ring-cleaving dioxygenase